MRCSPGCGRWHSTRSWLTPGSLPTEQDGFGKLVGDDWGYGWTAGVLVEPRSGTRFGAAYRSAIHHDLDGDARFRLDASGIGAALGVPAGTTPAKAHLTLPEIASFGAAHDIDDAWSVMADVTWTRWSRFRMLRVAFDDGVLPDDVGEEDWRDTWFFALGCSYRPDEEWTIRSGIAYDQSPARNRTRTPRTPSNSGVMLAVGTSYQPLPALGFSVGYAHWFIESARIDLQDSAPGNAGRGNLSGSSRNAVDTLSLQVTFGF
jgi:long-chain fatty acid transport protein